MAVALGQGWFTRNWRWAVPVGCLGLLAVAGALLLAIFSVAVTAVKSSRPFELAMSCASTNAALKAALGDPIRSGIFLQGNVNVETVNGVTSGRAHFTIPVSGPRRKATLHMKATLLGEDWRLEALDAELKGQKNTLNLLDAVPGGS